MDKSQRVFEIDGRRIRRNNYGLKIPFRKRFSDTFQIVAYRKANMDNPSLGRLLTSSLGDLFLEDSYPPNAKLGMICAHTGK